MHPINISSEDYEIALKINQIQDPKKKAFKIELWEKDTGEEFPTLFPNAESLRLCDEKGWEKVVNQPGLYTKGKIS